MRKLSHTRIYLAWLQYQIPSDYPCTILLASKSRFEATLHYSVPTSHNLNCSVEKNKTWERRAGGALGLSTPPEVNHPSWNF